MAGKRFSKRYCLLPLFLLVCIFPSFSAPAFKAIIWAIPQNQDQYHNFMNDAKIYIQKLGADSNFQADYCDDVSKFTDAFLSQYDLDIDIDLEVTNFNDQQKKAFENFINAGKGWVGVHTAGINKNNWPWFDAFLGGTRWNEHPYWEHALMNVEDTLHPATRTLPSKLWIDDECFQFNPTPKNIRVLASLDESTYHPSRPMGYHPIIWCNEKYPKTIYIAIGHSKDMWNQEQNFRRLIRDAILWAGRPATTAVRFLAAPDAQSKIDIRINPRDVSLAMTVNQFTATINDATGRTIAARASRNGTCSFHRGLFKSGVYFANISYESNRVVERIVLP
jgi:type 1 glutamine amidotransferase